MWCFQAVCCLKQMMMHYCILKICLYQEECMFFPNKWKASISKHGSMVDLQCFTRRSLSPHFRVACFGDPLSSCFLMWPSHSFAPKKRIKLEGRAKVMWSAWVQEDGWILPLYFRLEDPTSVIVTWMLRLMFLYCLE